MSTQQSLSGRTAGAEKGSAVSGELGDCSTEICHHVHRLSRVTCLEETGLPLFQSELREGTKGVEPLDVPQPVQLFQEVTEQMIVDSTIKFLWSR